MEWVEIIEPRTKEHMYANLTTGECVWDPPEGVSIKRTDSSQWWELFDSSTQRFYYYNVASQTTVWHRPQNCDIIPLAKLQTLKQNTETNDRKDGCTQTAHSKLKSKCNSDSSNRTDNNFRQYPSHIRVPSASSEDKIKGDLLGSPVGRHSYRHPTSEVGKNIDSYRYCKHSQDSVSRQKYKDVGKTHPHESGSLRMSSSHQKNQYLNENSYQKLQESSSSQNIPHSPFGSGGERHSHHHFPSHSKLSYSMSNSSDLGGISPTHSIHTPTFKKKVASDNQPIGNSSIGKHYQSFDCPGASNASIVSLTRSGSFMCSPTTSHHALPLTHHSSSHRKSSIDGNGGGASDDSMHEKYFKSSTSNKKQSRDSSPISPQNQTISKSARPSVLSSLSALEPPPTGGICYLSSSSHKSDHDVLNLDLTRKPEKYLDKMKIDKQRSPIPYTGHVSSATGLNYGLSDHQKISNVIRTSPSPGGSRNPIIGSSSSHFSNDYNPISSRNHAHLDQFLNRPNIERHNKDIKNMEKSSAGKNKKKRRSQHHTTSCSDVEYDNGNTSPLYSNWDQEMQEHLLPLQHYILEQAKLSGCHAFGDPLDSDSYHSDSQSEHSLSGHEPDNEDSDHSDHGGYLTHNYGLIDDYGDGISYYAYQFGAFDRSGREDISEHVEAVLESERENTRVYSPVRSHPYLEIQPSHSSNAAIDYQQQNQKQKQSQTLPSPNRQTSSKAAVREQKSQSPLKDDFLTTLNSKQNNFAVRTPNQSFTPPTPVTLSTPIVVPQLACMKECDIEKFAQDNLNLHSKGIFRKKASVRDMLSFTPDAISRPMLALARDKSGKKLATELFKLVQIYMGDRKARAGMSLNSVAIDIIVTALGQQQLRDELYVQLCRQTTENPKRESLIRGWELMAICLSFVPPSTTFQPALLNYVNRHRDPMFATSFPEVGKWPIHVQISHYATVCCKRLDRIGTSGRKQAKKPSEDEVEQARNHILRDSMFGNTLNEVMLLQKDKYPNRKLPWIQVTLSQQVLLLNGKQTEGIFRVSADVDEVNCLKTLLDRWEVPEHKNTMDAHAPASLLKLWYRELYDPLIPDELYNECVQTDNPEESEKIINRLPELNKLVLTYLVNFLQQFAKPDIVACTKMDSSNLAMVFAPNVLHCISDDPKIILENARKEMAFMRTLIQHMDTSSVANLV